MPDEYPDAFGILFGKNPGDILKHYLDKGSYFDSSMADPFGKDVTPPPIGIPSFPNLATNLYRRMP